MKRYNIRIDKNKLDSQSIARKKNFDNVVLRVKVAKKPLYRQRWFMANAIMLPIVVLVAFLVGEEEKPQTKQEQAFVKEPPRLNADVPFSTYIIDAGVDNTIIHNTGTQVHIPAHSLTSCGENTVEGEVEVKIREFQNAADFFLADIPMEYDSAGQTYTFESAGMIQIEAEQNGEKLCVADDKQVKVDLISNDADKNYNLYYLDSTTNKWEHKGKDKVVARREKEAPVNIPDCEEMVRATETQFEIIEMIEVDELEDAQIVEKKRTSREEMQRFAPLPQEDMAMLAEAAPIEDSVALSTPCDKIQLNEVALAKVERSLAQLKKREPIKPKEADTKKKHFSIEVSKEDFPEIAIYENTTFEVDESYLVYNPADANELWFDVVMRDSDKSHKYLVKFSNDNKTVEYMVEPVYRSADIGKAREVYKQKFEQYKKELKKKQEEQKRIQDEIDRLNAEREAMFAEQRRQNQKREGIYDTHEKIIRSFQIDNFGIYNCDRNLNVGNRVSLNLDFEMPDSLSLRICYMASKEQNAVIKFYNQGNRINNLYFNPDHTNFFWSVIAPNTLAIVTPAEFKKIDKTTKTIIPQIVEVEINEADDFRKIYESALNGEQLDDTEYELSINCFPNPCAERLHIKTKFDKEYVVQIASTNGRILKTETFEGMEGEIDVQDLTAGNYAISVSAVNSPLRGNAIVVKE